MQSCSLNKKDVPCYAASCQAITSVLRKKSMMMPWRERSGSRAGGGSLDLGSFRGGEYCSYSDS